MTFVDQIRQLLADKPELCLPAISPNLIPSSGKDIVQPTARSVFKNGHRSHYVGHFWSRKNQRLVPVESSLERDACLLLESVIQVRGYRSQPGRIVYRHDGANRNAFPDLEVIGEGVTLVEVKCFDRANTPAFRARAASIRASLAMRGVPYEILTEKEIRTPQLKNVRRVYRGARHGAHELISRRLLNGIQELPAQPTYAQLLADLRTLPLTVQAALDCAVLDRVIPLDFSRPLDDQSLQVTTAARRIP